MNILLTICARGGSKGLPKKNIKPLLGIPLIEYTINQAMNFKHFWILKYPEDEVEIVISTDDERIFDYENEELVLLRRRADLAGDLTPKVQVLQDALNNLEHKNKKRYNYIIDLDVTSPLRTNEDIIQVLNQANSDASIDLAFSVVPARRNPYFNLVEIEKDSGIAQKSKQGIYSTRQSAPICYDMNASIYAYKRSGLLKLEISPLEGRCTVHEMKETYVIDIDHPEDFDVLSCLASHGIFDWVPEIKKARESLNG